VPHRLPLLVARIAGCPDHPLLHASCPRRRVLPLLLALWIGPPFLPLFWCKETAKHSSTLPLVHRRSLGIEPRCLLHPPRPFAFVHLAAGNPPLSTTDLEPPPSQLPLVCELCLRSISGQLVLPLTSLVLQVPSTTVTNHRSTPPSGKCHSHRPNPPPHRCRAALVRFHPFLHVWCFSFPVLQLKPAASPGLIVRAAGGCRAGPVALSAVTTLGLTPRASAGTDRPG
jgi:hypothetical protein